jgi:hypothetical protein
MARLFILNPEVDGALSETERKQIDKWLLDYEIQILDAMSQAFRDKIGSNRKPPEPAFTVTELDEEDLDV